jgi:hypothetical protein
MMKHRNLISPGHFTPVSCSIDVEAHQAFSRFGVSNGDDDPRRMVDRFSIYFQRNSDACPAFFPGTLEQALNEAFQTRSMEDVRLALHFV